MFHLAISLALRVTAAAHICRFAGSGIGLARCSGAASHTQPPGDSDKFRSYEVVVDQYPHSY